MGPMLRWALAFAAVLGLAAWFLTAPGRITAAELSQFEPDVEHGERIFLAAGCASCHTAPEGTQRGNGTDGPGGTGPVLAGGQRFVSDFGTFLAPNISSDETHGIGAWSDAALVTAIMEGTSPDGAHYYPVFPYAAYGLAERGDIVDLVAYMRTLPASDVPSQPHEVSFPFTLRRGIGLWKLAFRQTDWAVPGPLSEPAERGRYLAEALGHCAECHTPRNSAGGLRFSEWLAGAPVPDGPGRVPGITPALLDWSQADIAYYLETGLTPDYDSAGGHMVAVIDKLSQLPQEDRDALASYLVELPGR
ncbi:c-type cytochrome [Profundibacterium mesophilum]|uniref:Diheme cytochrome c-type n=1 Tax=Profundibacterium mesophilum KAUST100406-0324 TaxID=1037889 RepID=A0A921TGI3_9RHOB|nr:cytochrome c [Profundibacterium mesophilum]KAF0677474.1 Diheme cytochrome c-type [Profundibacterium mesophilum KAUST100406-0324]